MSERWTHKEIKDFLAICKRKRIFRRMKHKNYRFDDILSDIKQDMKKLGYVRTINQMSLKLKKLRLRYQLCFPPNAGWKRLRNQFAFYETLHEMSKDADYDSDNDREDQSDEDDEDEVVCYNDDDSDHERYIDVEVLKEEEINPLDLSSEVICEEINEIKPASKKDVEVEEIEERDGTKENKKGPDNILTNYKECFKVLVTQFVTAQEDLQKQFFQQQLVLQQQQQEWEERILDEEREFFAKILSGSKP